VATFLANEINTTEGDITRPTAHVQIMSSLSNGNRTEWSPIRSVIIRVITKSDNRAAGV